MGAPLNAIGPQPGPQERFLASPADIVIYGGQAGGGKSFGILLEAARNKGLKGFSAIIFRREITQITAPGGLWDETIALYPMLGGVPRSSPHLSWRFQSGAAIQLRHLQYENDVFAYQGAQIPLICWDELTHFTARQFWYMLSRNRSVCGVRP